MLQERKGFFYEPELLDYKPVYARPDMNTMLKIIEAGAEKVAHQQDMLNKVEDSVRKTPAYLDQDIDYVGNVTKQIDTEISGMMDGTVDLLDPANTGKVMQIAKKYMYDPELAKITSRTGKISKSQEQIEAMRKANKISAANYWEFNQSILNANNEFANSKKYNPDVNLHYDIVPYGDVAAEGMKVVAATKTFKNTYTVHGADGYIRTETIDAANTDIAAEMYNAAINKDAEAYEKAKQLNDQILTNQFVNTLSGEALGQLKAEARMLGKDEGAYITERMKGYVEMVNGYSHTVDGMVFDKNIEMKITYDNAVKLKQIDYANQRNLDAIRAAREAAENEKKRAHELKLAGMRKGKGGSSGEDGEDGEDGGLIGNAYRNVRVTEQQLTIPARAEMFGIKKEDFSYNKVTSLITEKQKSLKDANKQAQNSFLNRLNKNEYPGLKGKAYVTTDPNTGKLTVVATTANLSDPATLNSLTKLKAEVTHHNASVDATLISIAEMKNWKTAQDNMAGITPQERTAYEKTETDIRNAERQKIVAGFNAYISSGDKLLGDYGNLYTAMYNYTNAKTTEEKNTAWKLVEQEAKNNDYRVLKIAGNQGVSKFNLQDIYYLETKVKSKLDEVEKNTPKLKQVRTAVDASFKPISVSGPAYSLKGVGVVKGYSDEQMYTELRNEIPRNANKIIDNTTGELAAPSAMPLIYKTIKDDMGATTIQYNPTTGKYEMVITTAQVDREGLALSYRLPVSDKLLDYFGMSDMQSNEMNVAIDARLYSTGLAPVPGTNATIKTNTFSPNTSERTYSLDVHGLTIPLTEAGISTMDAANEVRKIELGLVPTLIANKSIDRNKKLGVIASSLIEELRCTPESARYIADKMLTNQETK